MRNPFQQDRISAVDISEHVDGIVFWSKNPEPLFEKLHVFDHIPYYFQYTLNAYGRDIEPNLPPLAERIATMRQLAQVIGPERVIWRYDPILISPTYDEEFHIRQFRTLAENLNGFTDTCIISFVDMYRHISKRMKSQGACAPDKPAVYRLSEAIHAAAAASRIQVCSCAEAYDLSRMGINAAACIDAQRLSSIGGKPLQVPRDTGQRKYCGCAGSIDIGMYNTCRHGCLYCYANRGSRAFHEPSSPLLAGKVSENDHITPRRLRSAAAAPSLFTSTGH